MSTDTELHNPVITDEIDALIAADEGANTEDDLSSVRVENQASTGEDNVNIEQSKSESSTSASEKKPETVDADSAAVKEKPISQYEKAKKDSAEREARAWKKINEEKEALKEQQRLLDQERAQLNQAPQKAATDSSRKYSKADYLEYAKANNAAADALEKEGKFEEADEKRSLAKLAERQAASAPDTVAETPVQAAKQANFASPQMSPQQQAQFNVQQRQSWEQAKQDIPELADKKSPITRGVAKLLQGEMSGALLLPGGPAAVARLVKAEDSAAKVPDLEKTIKEQQMRIAELEEATSLGGGGSPPGSIPETPFEQKSLHEQEEELRRELGA